MNSDPYKESNHVDVGTVLAAVVKKAPLFCLFASILFATTQFISGRYFSSLEKE